MRLIIGLFFLCNCFLLSGQPQFSWAGQFNASSYGVGVKALASDKYGNIYSTGDFLKNVDFDPGPSLFYMNSAGSAFVDDIFISKLDPSGNFIWAKRIGGNHYDRVYDMEVDDDGNVYTIGTVAETADFDPGAGTYLLSPSSYNSFISKLDKDGNFVWAKILDNDYYNEGMSIGLDGSGNVFIAGYFYDTLDVDPGAGIDMRYGNGLNDIYITKLDYNGDFIWSKIIGGAGMDDVRSLAVDGFGNVICSGVFSEIVDFDPGPGTYTLGASGTSYRPYLLKLDGNGDFVFAKTFDNGYATIYQLAVDSIKNIFLTGEFSGSVDFDPGSAVYDLTNPVITDPDVFVCNLDINGNFRWARQLPGTDDQAGYGIDVSRKGHVFITGRYYNSIDLDPGPATYPLICTGYCDGFVCELNQEGFFVCGGAFHGTEHTGGLAVCLGPNDQVYVGGNLERSADLDMGADSAVFSCAANVNAFIGRYDPCYITAVAATVEKHEIEIFPNPSSGIFHLRSDQETESFRVFDIYGKCLRQSCVSKTDLLIDLSKEPSGIYLLELSSGDMRRTIRLVRE